MKNQDMIVIQITTEENVIEVRVQAMMIDTKNKNINVNQVQVVHVQGAKITVTREQEVKNVLKIPNTG